MTGALQPPPLPLPNGAAADDAPPPWFRRLVSWSVASAVAAAVPVPLLDDHLVRVSRRRMVRELCQEAGMVVQDHEVAILSGTGRRPLLGCAIAAFVGLIVRVVLKVVRRFFRSLLIFLTARDAANAASRTFHEGYLLAAALDFGVVGSDADEEQRTEQLELLRDRIEEAASRARTSPIRSAMTMAFTTSGRLVRDAARALARFSRRSRPSETDAANRLVHETPQPLVERLTLDLWHRNRDLVQLAELMRPARHGRDPAQPVL